MPSKEPIPQSLLIECDDPILLEDNTGKAILNNNIANAELWKSCRDTKKKLIEAVKATQ